MSQNRSTRTIAITSGKGGVGKTNLCVNLALVLAQLGQRTCVFDADLGLANINILLGLDFNRSVPIVILKYLYELELIEQKKEKDYKKPSNKQIKTMVNQALVNVKEKKDILFSQWISDGDYDAVFNPESLRASFIETGRSHIPYTYYIDSLEKDEELNLSIIRFQR